MSQNYATAVNRLRPGLLGWSPMLFLFSGYYLIQAEAISLEHRYFQLILISRKVDENLGLIIFGLGLVFWLAAVFFIIPAWFKRSLAVTGPYAICRHPQYAALLWILLPATGLMLHSWLVLSNAGVSWLVCRWLIRREEKKLMEIFKDEYSVYVGSVPGLLPWPRPRPKT